MQESKQEIIKCPYCGYEYLPVEIFYPDDLLGKPSYISRDLDGCIDDYVDNDMNQKQEFTCDRCGHVFSVEAKIKFIVSQNDLHNFDEDYTSKIYTKERFNLDEDK